MRVIASVIVAVATSMLVSCVAPISTDQQTDWTNPDPEVERLHVQAFNLDLGKGVPQDRVKANQLYLQAARRGDPRSMMNYAINLANGQGVPADLVEAYSWTEAARFLTQRMPDMKIKWRIRSLNDELRKALASDQLKEGKRCARTKLSQIGGGAVEHAGGSHSDPPHVLPE